MDRKQPPRKRFRSTSNLEEYGEILADIEKKTIKDVDIVESQMSRDNKIWFIEQLGVLKHLDSNTDQYVELRNRIYNKFKRLKDNNEYVEILDKYNELDTLKNKINQKVIPDDVRNILIEKYEELCKYSKQTEEYMKYFTWINWILSVPTISKQISLKGTADLLRVKDTLDRELFGMHNAKDRVLEIAGAMITNQNYKNKCIALRGPPGVGKTVFGRAIANSLNLPFEQISLGGMKDSSYLTGHCHTYIGAKPGVIVSSLKKIGCKNGIIFFDELDKIQESDGGKEISSTLLHILDPSQNHDFRDQYMQEISINLSEIFFILSLNDTESIDKVLLDRLHIIDIDGYTIQDKITIGLNYVLPKIYLELNIKIKDVIVSDDIMTYIIGKTPQEHGVRRLEENIKLIFEKINVLMILKRNRRRRKGCKQRKINYGYCIDNFKLPFILTKKHVDRLWNVRS